MYSIYIQRVCLGGGGVELCCRPYSAGILRSVSDQILNLPNCFTTPNKMTSEDDIKGLVSLKFLRPCFIDIWSMGNPLTTERAAGGERFSMTIFAGDHRDSRTRERFLLSIH